MNFLAFILDLYVGSTRAEADVPRFRSVARAFLTDKRWTRLEVAHMLSDEKWCNWFSLEQKAKLSNDFSENPNLGKLEVPMAWSVNEAFGTHWKASFEPLRLWLAVRLDQESEEDETLATWVPMVWPSYLSSFRWQLLLATRGTAGQKVTLAPNMLGFPTLALTESEIKVGASVFFANVHFMLPEEAVLRLTNPEVPVYDERRGGSFSPYQYKSGTRASALEMARQDFPGARDTGDIIATEIARHEFVSTRFVPFWLNARQRIPRSVDSTLEVAESETSDSARVSIDDDEAARP